jgi:hypothetical protein
MRATPITRTRLALATCVSTALAGCAMPINTTKLAGGPDPVSVEMTSRTLHPGQAAQLIVRSPGADSIVYESANGLDRYWSTDSVLSAVVTSDFGDRTPVSRYAERRNGQSLNLLQKPARIAVCRQSRCREFQHEFAVILPERNNRSIAISAGWSSVFARRSLRGANRTVLFEDVVNAGVWEVQADWAGNGWNGRVQGVLGNDFHGGSLDLSRLFKEGDGLGYGLAMNTGVMHAGWLGERPGSVPADRTAYRVSLGPSIMLRGITASTQFGISTDGRETLQIASTRISVNGNLTSVRQPITITAEKTFAFGGGAILARRRDALERLTAGVRVLDNFSINLGLSSHRMAWPTDDPSEDVRGAETLFTLGGQYSLTW